MSSTTAQQGTDSQTKKTAAAIFERAFFPGREPRSKAYREGVLQTLQHRLDGTPYPPLPYRLGTAERDAYFSGMDEGHVLARTAVGA